MMKCWEGMAGYEEFVKKEWFELKVEGWKGYVLKEKLKGIKYKLKDWNKEHIGNLDTLISKAKEELSRLDLKGENGALAEEEVSQRRMCRSRLQLYSSRKCSFLWQKSRLRWLKEGDANSKFFQGCVQRRRKINEILGMDFEGEFVEEVEPMKIKIKEYFESHFKKVEGVSPTIGNLNISTLGEFENNILVEPFSEEVKNAVWNCDSYKSPGPDRVSFAFIKQFWDVVKADFIGFLDEFHKNGKLVRV